jgi:hypothetical protein
VSGGTADIVQLPTQRFRIVISIDVATTGVASAHW